jgi:DNA-binding MarR family transcriptional regulator
MTVNETELSQLDYKELAARLLSASHPREKRRPPTELEKHEHVKDGTIRYLFEHDCTASPGQLVEFFGFSQARLTKILSELEDEGMLVRSCDTADRRRVIVHLTEQGQAYAIERHTQTLLYMTSMLEALGKEDAEHFVRILEKLHSIMPDSPCQH